MLWLVRSAIVMLFPRTELPGAEDCDLQNFLVRFKRDTPFLVWLGTVAGAVLFHLTPLFTVFVPLPAFWLPKSLAARHADRIATTNFYVVRQAVLLVKMCGALCWGADPNVRKAFALPPLGVDPGTWRAP